MRQLACHIIAGVLQMQQPDHVCNNLVPLQVAYTLSDYSMTGPPKGL